MNPVARLIGTMFGSGLSPIMPGTCGSIVAVLIIAFIPDPAYAWTTAVLAIIATVTGPALARSMMRESGRSDPQSFVYDEAAGVWIAAFRPEHPGWIGILVALVLFRIFDMTKPWPIRRIEKWPNGHGVVHDDVFAGLVALAIGWGLIPLFT